jgi:hypothetical protein
MEKIESDLEPSLANEECDLDESESVQSQKVQLNENGELVISVKPVYDENGFLVIDGSQGEMKFRFFFL